VQAINANNRKETVEAFLKLGVEVNCEKHSNDKQKEEKAIEALCLTMLDTRRVKDFNVDPFDPNNNLKSSTVTKLPPDLYFIVRAVQLLRGICFALDLDYSLSKQLAPYARQVLEQHAQDQKNTHTQFKADQAEYRER